MKKLGLGALILFFLFCGTNALAVSYSFSDILPDDDIDISENFKVNVSYDSETGKAVFKITNTGDITSYILGIYWEDPGELLSNMEFSSALSTGEVEFDDKTTTGSTPPGDDDFETAFYAQAHNTGINKLGLDVGEAAVFTFDIASSDFDNLVESGMQMAVDVQHIDGDKKDNDTYFASITPVPEPATMLLLGAGLIGAAGLGRKKLFKKK